MSDGILSKGITLSYSTSSTGTYTALDDLQSIPDLGGTKDSVEITTLADSAHRFMDGLLNYGDSIDFTFLYAEDQFGDLNDLSGTIYWKVGLPDGTAGAVGTTCAFSGISSVRLNGVGTNSPITYTLSIKPNSEMVFA